MRTGPTGASSLSLWQGSRREWLLIAAIFAGLAGVAGVWLALDRRPPEWDHANHLERVVNGAHDMAHANVAAIIERSSFYPPLAACAAGLAYSLAPSDVASAQVAILGFLALGMASVYVLARSSTSGVGSVVAALLFGSANFVVYSSLRFQLDLPLAGMVAVALVLLLRVEGFSRLGWSIALGVVLGLGMLTKPPFPVYVLPAFVLVGAQGAWSAATRRPPRRRLDGRRRGRALVRAPALRHVRADRGSLVLASGGIGARGSVDRRRPAVLPEVVRPAVRAAGGRFHGNRFRGGRRPAAVAPARQPGRAVPRIRGDPEQEPPLYAPAAACRGSAGRNRVRHGARTAACDGRRSRRPRRHRPGQRDGLRRAAWTDDTDRRRPAHRGEPADACRVASP